RAVHVRLGGEVDDGVDVVLAEEPLDERAVLHLAVHEGVARGVREAFEVAEAAGVGERVERDDARGRRPAEEPADEVGADEPGAAGDEDVLHQGREVSHALAACRGGAYRRPFRRAASAPATASSTSTRNACRMASWAPPARTAPRSVRRRPTRKVA